LIKQESLLCDVIIVNYNAGAVLSACVASLVSPKLQSIIIVDNASTDDSLMLLEKNHPNDSRLNIICNSTNLGFATACNQGITVSTQPLVLFLNPDCTMTTESLERLIDVLLSATEIGMVGGFLCNPDGTEQVGGRRLIPTPWRTLVRVLKLSRLAKYYPRLFADFNLHKQPLPDSPIEVEAISGACMLVKREALNQVGGFDADYFLHCEDLDWCMRFWEKNWKILFVPDAQIIHDQGTCSRSRPIFVEWHKHQGMMRFYHKFFRQRYSRPLMWLITFGVWLRFSLLVVYYSVQKLIRGIL
jgi:GT2 family glycosyltransferase